MRKLRSIEVLYTHTEGEPTCIVTGGLLYPPGLSILQQREHLETRYDWLRRALMQEPRGHHDMYGVFLTPPKELGAHAGTVWMNSSGFMHTCGHGTICTSSALVATGLVPAPEQDGEVEVRFETTAGPVAAEVRVEGDRVAWSRYRNVPTYVVARDVPVELPGLPPATADVVFSGNFFGLVDFRGRAPRIERENGSAFSQLGLAVRSQLRQKVPVRHPVHTHIDKIETITFYQEPSQPDARYRCVHVFGQGHLDRSPGGAGTAAMLCMLEARGELALHQTILAEGILGAGRFEGCLVGEVDVAGQRAVLPTIKGRAELLGSARWLLDPTDEVAGGFLLS